MRSRLKMQFFSRNRGRFGALLLWSVLCLTPTLALSNTKPAAKPSDTLAVKMQTLQQSDQRWIQIHVGRQRLIAWEGGKPVYAIIISTGKASSPTPTGTFAIQSKHRVARMQGAGYDIPDVPYTMYYSGHYGIHGAYWHHKFGTPVSNGCTNVAVNHAQWLFEWASVGTPVVVHP